MGWENFLILLMVLVIGATVVLFSSVIVGLYAHVLWRGLLLGWGVA